MTAERVGLETLLMDTLDAVSRFRVGQRESISAALEAGRLLMEAKLRVSHGGFQKWIERVGLAPRTARTWMTLAKRELTVDQVVEAGGINAASRNGITAPEAVLTNRKPARELAAVEGALAEAKTRYYNTLTRRQELLREIARTKTEEVI